MNGVNLGSAWEVAADHWGDRPALIQGPLHRTWTEFEDRSSRLAGALATVGLGAGDNVALALLNGNEYLEAEFAAFKLRAAPCNVNYRYVEKELHYLVDNSDAKAVFFDATLAERFAGIVGDLPKVRLWVQVGDGPCPEWATPYEEVIGSSDPEPRIDRRGDDLWILYTGGTTGNPKGVMWPHDHLAQLAGPALSVAGIDLPQNATEVTTMLDALDRLDAVPRSLAAAPLMHGTAGIGALFTLFQGGTVVTSATRKYDPVETLEIIARDRVRSMAIVGDVFAAPLVDALDRAEAAGSPHDISSLRMISSSGVMWSREVKDRLLAHAEAAGTDLILRDSLGASEGVGFGGKQSSVGGDTETAKFALGPNAAVFAEDGRRITPGSDERGLLAVTGPIPMGYYGDPVKSAETFREIEGTRWSIPGDWATVAEDGSVTLLGRGSVSINTGGEKVFPEEVEEALKRQPSVVDAVVVGVPDEKWGAAVTAVIELTDGSSTEDGELLTALRSELAAYKLPKRLVRVSPMFRGPNGKADYTWALQQATATD